MTCETGQNVRAFDRRIRSGGGKRPGLLRAFSEQLTGQINALIPWRLSQQAATINPDTDPGPGPVPEQWIGLGLGVNSDVFAIAGFGTPRNPHFGGAFSQAGGAAANLAVWDEATDLWSAVAGVSGGSISTIVSGNLGSGDRLFVCAGQAIWEWDGTTLTDLGDVNTSAVTCMAVYDDGAGPELFIGGNFSAVESVSATRIASWNGSNWSAVGTGLGGQPESMTVWNNGVSDVLVVAGNFTTAGGSGISRVATWNGSAYGALGLGIDAMVNVVESIDLGAGAELYAGGIFVTVEGGTVARRISKWNGANWVALNIGLFDDTFRITAGVCEVRAITKYDDGSGDALWVGGEINAAATTDNLGVALSGIAKWDGTNWSSPPRGIANQVNALAAVGSVFESTLYAGGDFDAASVIPSGNIVAYDGTTYSQAGFVMYSDATNGNVPGMAVGTIAGLTGERLYIGMADNVPGAIQQFGAGATPITDLVAAWNGTTLERVGSDNWTTSATVLALAVWDDGGGTAELYAGGSFTSPGTRLAMFDGLTWGTVSTGANSTVRDFAIWNDGTSEALYFCGDFTTPGNRIGLWDGTTFFSLTASGESANGVAGAVRSILPTTLLGSGSNALVLAGDFTSMGDGTLSDRVGYWDPASSGSWNAMGDGFNTTVYTLAEFDGNIYAGGNFTVDGDSGATTYNRIAVWNGSSWASIGAGFNDAVSKLVVFNSRLYAIGEFTLFDSTAMRGIARLNVAKTGFEATTGEGVPGFVNSTQTGGTAAVYNSKLYVQLRSDGVGGEDVSNVAKAAVVP